MKSSSTPGLESAARVWEGAQIHAPSQTGDSHRQLAERMGLSHDFITRVRRELEATGVIARVEKVAGKDGKEYHQPPPAEPQTAAQVSSDDTCPDPNAADDLNVRIEANDGNPVALATDPNDPTEDRGDAWEGDATTRRRTAAHFE